MINKLIKKEMDRFLGRTRYYLNSCGNKGGPNIFGKRLKAELKKSGWIYNSKVFDYNLTFISGKYFPGKVNILRLDNLYFDIENTSGDNNKLNAPIKEAYDKFDKIIFQGEFSRKIFFAYFGAIDKPYRIIYNGVPRYFSPEGKRYKYPFSKTLICSSKWIKPKRLGAIVEGVRKLKTQNVGLVVLGAGAKAESGGNIICLGNIPPHKLPYYLRGADAFVHLSWVDCCPNVVVEALACGLPVLCSHNGGTKELVGDSGIVLELEETYNLQKIALFKPPMPDPKLVAQGMEDLLSWDKPVFRPDFYLDNVARQYIDFMQS